MIAYLVFFAIEVAFIFGARYFGFKNSLIILVPAIVLASVFSGLRGNIGTDTYSYRFFYNNFLHDEQLAFEPIFSAIAFFGGLIGLPDQFFLACISAIQAIFLILLIRQIQSRDLFLLIYLATYYINFNFNLIRFGTAILITGFACLLSQKNNQGWSRILYFGGLASHFSMILCAPFFSLSRRSIVLAISFMLLITVLVFPLLQMKFENLSIQGCVNGWSPTFGVGFILEILIFGVVVINLGRFMDARLVAALLGYIFFRLSGCVIPGGDRITMLFGFLFYLFLFSKNLTLTAKLFLSILIIYNFYGTIMFLQESDQAMEALISEQSNLDVYEKTKWLPYKFYWEEALNDNPVRDEN